MAKLFEHFYDQDLEETKVRIIPTTKTKVKGYWIHYAFINPYTKRRTHNRFCFNPPRPELNYALTLRLAQTLLASYKVSTLSGLSKQDPNRLYPRCVKSELFMRYNLLRRSKNGFNILKDDMVKTYDNENKKESYYIQPKIFLKDQDESGKTFFFAGASFSGKTYFLVQQLNHLVNKKRGGQDPHMASRPMYDKIIILTSSPNAKPLKEISAKLDVIIVPFFCRRIIAILKMINDATLNSCPFLIVLDDVFDSLKGNMFKKLVCTMRNANVSTVCLSQYFKHCEPQTRNSFHQIFITKFKTEEWKYIIQSAIKDEVEEMLNMKGSPDKLAGPFKNYVGQDIVAYNVREDNVKLIERNYKKT